MKITLLSLALLISVSCQAQSWNGNGALASQPPPAVSGNVYVYLSGTCTGTSCTGPVVVCLSSNSTSCGGAQVANTSIFYTLDGSPANEADIYYGPGGSGTPPTGASGQFTIPDPGTTRSITVNAVLVQTTCTSTTCNGYPVTGCSTSSPCQGEIVQNGMNIKSVLNTNVACPASGTDSCPASVFAQTNPPISGGTQVGSATAPPVQHGNCTSGDDLGVRGSPTGVWYYVSQPQPTVDVYTNTSLTVEMDIATTSAVDCAGTSGEGDTEDLIPAIRVANLNPARSALGCDTCTQFAVSFYVGHVYEGSPASGTTLNPANLSDLEMDQNQDNATFNTATGYGYGTFNSRCSPQHASPVVVGGKKYGQFEYSSQNGANSGWDAYPKRFTSLAAITHDCTMPFGTISSQTSSSTTVPTFTPGTTNSLYNGGEASYGLEPGILFVDQGTSSAESELLLGPPGGSITGVIRGIGGTTPHAHSSGAFATLAVKVQTHATQDVTTGATGCIGTSNANAMYEDYLSMNGNYYGTAAYQSLMGSGLRSPTITVLDTWGTQTISGRTRSIVCSYFGTSSSGTKFFDQKQPYMKAGTGNAAKTGIFDMHDGVTASWGIIGSPTQAIITQAH